MLVTPLTYKKVWYAKAMSSVTYCSQVQVSCSSFEADPPKKWMSSISIYLQTWWVQSDVNVAVVSATTKMLVPPLPIWRCATQKPIAFPDSHPEVDRISYTYSSFFQNKIRGSFFSMNLLLQDILLTDPKTNLHCDIRIWNMPIPIPVLMKVRVLWGGGLRKDGWMER